MLGHEGCFACEAGPRPTQDAKTVEVVELEIFEGRAHEAREVQSKSLLFETLAWLEIADSCSVTEKRFWDNAPLESDRV